MLKKTSLKFNYHRRNKKTEIKLQNKSNPIQIENNELAKQIVENGMTNA